MSDTVVIHARHENQPEYAGRMKVYIGRRHSRNGKVRPASKWANPYRIGGPQHDDRATVIRLYESYLRNDHDLLAQVHELRGCVLMCWCKPEACHGDVLVKLLAELEAER